MTSHEQQKNPEPDILRAYRATLGEYTHELARLSPGAVGFALFVGERKRLHRRVGETSATHTTILTAPSVEPDSPLLQFQTAAIEKRQITNAVSTVGRMSPGDNGKVLQSRMNPHHLTVGHLASHDHRVIAQAAIDRRYVKHIDTDALTEYIVKRRKTLGQLAANLSDYIGARADYDEVFSIDEEPVSANSTIIGFDITDSTSLSARNHRKLLRWLEEFETENVDGEFERIQFSGDGAFYARHMSEADAVAAATSSLVPANAAHFASKLLDSYGHSDTTGEFSRDHPVRIAVANGWLSAEAGQQTGNTLWGLTQILETMPRSHSSIYYSQTGLTKQGEALTIPL